MGILIGILLILIVGILPMIVYALILWWFDRYEKEPLGLLIAAFLWGAIPAVIFSIIAELVLDIPIAYFVDPVAAGVIGIAVVAPIAEEIFKGMALLLLLLFFRKEIDSPLDGIISADWSVLALLPWKTYFTLPVHLPRPARLGSFC